MYGTVCTGAALTPHVRALKWESYKMASLSDYFFSVLKMAVYQTETLFTRTFEMKIIKVLMKMTLQTHWAIK